MAKTPADVYKFYIYRGLIKRFMLPVVNLHMLLNGLSVYQIATINAIAYLVGLILEVPSGAIGDKVGHKRTVVASGFIQAIGILLYLGNSYYWYLGSFAIYWAGAAFRSGTDSSLFYERLKYLGLEKQHQKYSGRSRTASGAIGIVFMTLAGFTYQLWWPLPFIITAIQYPISSMLIATFGPTSHDRKDATTKENVSIAIEEIKNNNLLLFFVIFQGIIFGTVWTLMDFDQIILSFVGLSAGVIGLVYAVKRVVLMVVTYTAHSMEKKIGPINMVILTALMAIAGPLILYFWQGRAAVITSIVVIVFAQSLVHVNVNDYIHQLAESRVRATIHSLAVFMATLVSTTSIYIIGLVSRNSDIFNIIGLFGVLIVVMLIALATKISRKDFAQLN